MPDIPTYQMPNEEELLRRLNQVSLSFDCSEARQMFARTYADQQLRGGKLAFAIVAHVQTATGDLPQEKFDEMLQVTGLIIDEIIPDDPSFNFGTTMALVAIIQIVQQGALSRGDHAEV